MSVVMDEDSVLAPLILPLSGSLTQTVDIFVRRGGGDTTKHSSQTSIRQTKCGLISKRDGHHGCQNQTAAVQSTQVTMLTMCTKWIQVFYI